MKSFILFVTFIMLNFSAFCGDTKKNDNTSHSKTNQLEDLKLDSPNYFNNFKIDPRTIIPQQFSKTSNKCPQYTPRHLSMNKVSFQLKEINLFQSKYFLVQQKKQNNSKLFKIFNSFRI